VQCVGFGVVWPFSGALCEAMGGSAFLRPLTADVRARRRLWGAREEARWQAPAA
jgi:hypothetical protein